MLSVLGVLFADVPGHCCPCSTLVLFRGTELVLAGYMVHAHNMFVVSLLPIAHLIHTVAHNIYRGFKSSAINERTSRIRCLPVAPHKGKAGDILLRSSNNKLEHLCGNEDFFLTYFMEHEQE